MNAYTIPWRHAAGIPLSFNFHMEFQEFHSGPENLKKTRPKKLVKSNKTINFFYQIPFFAISKLAKNQFMTWGKKN